MNKKIAYITNLRVFACVGVILCHVATDNWYGNIESKRWMALSAYIAFSRFCVPVFFMISGALFLQKDKKIIIKKFFLENLLRLFIFLIFWGECYQIYNLSRFQNEDLLLSLKDGIINVLKGDTQVHLWYIYTIIGIYLVVPLMKPWINNLSKRQIEYYLLLFVLFNSVYSIICNFNLEILIIIRTWLSRFSVNIVGGYIGYFVLGYYLNTYDTSAKVRKRIYLLGSVSLILCIICTINYCRKISQPVEIFWEYNSCFILCWSVCVFVFFKYNIDKTCQYISRISECTLGIYAIHMLIVFELRRWGMTSYLFNPVLSVPLIVLIVFGASFLIISILRRCTILKKWIV